MVNRRGALVAIGVTALGALERLVYGSFSQPDAAFGAELMNSVEDSVSADLARVGAHTYSEEGIPMFLACENLAANRKPSERAPVLSALNGKVASAFHRYTGEWQHIHPQAPASDVAKIVEVLADQDFAKGGAERSL